jgi:hypothetical protein
LFLLLQLLDEIGSNFKDDSHEPASNRLRHHVFELYLLADQVNGRVGFVQEPTVELDALSLIINAFRVGTIYNTFGRLVMDFPPF